MSFTSRQPLLSSPQAPGMSYPHSHTPQDPLARRLASSMSRRMGPSASENSSPSSTRLGPTRNLVSNRGAITASNGEDFVQFAHDDDDMDDHLHTFTAAERIDISSPFDITSWRGWGNAITLIVLMGAIIGIFALYPIISFYADESASGRKTSGYNLGGINGTGQFPDIPGLPQLIDRDTPADAYTKTGLQGDDWVLVFSDEFEVEGRTFYPGGKCCLRQR